MERKLNLSKEYLDNLISTIIATVPTEAIYIFGSYARGEERSDSDLDIYVIVSDENKKPIEYSIDISLELFNPYSKDHLIKDILCSTKEKFEENKKDISKIEYVISLEGIKVYEKV